MSFQKIIKQNLALITGLLLPVLMIAFFMLAQALNAVQTPNPQYDFLIGINTYQEKQQKDFYHELLVKDNQLNVQITPVTADKAYLLNKREMLYRFNASEQTFTPISYTLPTKIGKHLITETKEIKLTSQDESLDGFTFIRGNPSYDKSFLLDLMVDTNAHYNNLFLKHKNGGLYKLPKLESMNYYNDFQFYGWIEK